MQLDILIFICLMNSVIISSSNLNPLFDTSSSSIQSTSSSTSEPSIKAESNTTTERPHYPDTYSPGSILGIAMCWFLLIFIISFGSYQIGRRRLYYIPYYNNYQPVS